MPRTKVIDRINVLPFTDASDLHLRIARSFTLITEWNAALGGRFSFDDVMHLLIKQVRARNIALYRFENDRALPIGTVAHASVAASPELSSGALASFLQMHFADDLIPGTIWRLKKIAKHPAFSETAGAREWAARPDILEVSIVVLGNEAGRLDLLEMVFDMPTLASPELPVSLVTHAMAEAWSIRTPGLVAKAIRTYGRHRGKTQNTDGGILSTRNPCGLSRSELRVCQLLTTGAKAKEIAEALNVSMPTVRTHLRNIYAKTETAGQVDLIAVINGETDAGAPE